MNDAINDEPEKKLRRGWTTGACAAAAAKAAFSALAGHGFPDPVTIPLPKGGTAAFALAETGQSCGAAWAGVIKDAGDDPDVTHGALIRATVRGGAWGSGITFKAGEGVGTVTKPGLPLLPGEPAINPGPRAMIKAALAEVGTADLIVEIAVPGGEKLAAATWNPRLGIVGGLSVLGTTGVVVPYSCSAWIHAIRSGIDVARACRIDHVAACTGKTSEAGARAALGLGAEAIIDMGDFAGGMLKYLRDHPIPHLTIAGGFAKLAKLAQGHMDLHSKRSQVDIKALARLARDLGADGQEAAQIAAANTAQQALSLFPPLGDAVADGARAQARKTLGDAPIVVDVLAFDRAGRLIGRAA